MRRLAWVVLSALFFAAACNRGPSPPVTTGDFGQRTPAYLAGLIPVVGVGVGDQTDMQFIVDTGSPVTLLNATSFGHASDYSASGATDLQAFNLAFSAVPTVTYGAFGTDACGDITFAGILGGDLLRYYDLTIDYLGSALFLWDGLDGSPDIGQDVAAAQEVPIHVKGGGRAAVVGVTVDLPATRIVATGTLEGAESTFLVDSGASMVTLPQRVFDTLADQDRARIADVPVETVYGTSNGFIVRLRSLSLGAVTVTNVPAFVVPDATLFDDVGREVGASLNALVGGTFLRNFQTTIRYPASRIALAQYNNPVHVNPREFVSPGFDLGAGCNGGAFVVKIYPGTSAADAGIQAGYQLWSIDTQSLSGMSIDDADRLLHSYDPGSVVSLTMNTFSGVRSFDLTYSDLLPPF